MEDSLLLWKGVLLGFAIAAPVGPIGVLCIQRTLVFGRWTGFATGLGAATADALYGAIAAFGITLVINFLVDQSSWVRPIGGLFIVWIGVQAFRAKPHFAQQQDKRRSNRVTSYLTGLVLTLTNPLTVFSFIAAFAIIAPASGSIRISQAILMVTGVFTGSVAWWFMLTSIITMFHSKVRQDSYLLWINRISGAFLIFMGTMVMLANFWET